MRENLRYALPRTIPVMCGYIFLGIAFGVVMAEAGYGLLPTLLMSVCVFAGSLQFVMVPLLAAACPPLTMAVTALAVNSRHLFYGLSFIESFRKLRARPYLIFALSDETYSLLCGESALPPEQQRREAWFFIALLDQCWWVLGSVLGVVLGRALPFDLTGIDFAMTALFTAIFTEQLLTGGRPVMPVALGSLAAGLACLFFLGASGFLLPALVLAVAIAAAAGNLQERGSAA